MCPSVSVTPASVCILCPEQVLESFKIMDYSLLLGIHVLDMKLRDRGGRGDSKRQKVLYSTALESIQGGGKAVEPHPNSQDDDTSVQHLTFLCTLCVCVESESVCFSGRDVQNPAGGCVGVCNTSCIHVV